jgi:hypothetical protein
VKIDNEMKKVQVQVQDDFDFYANKIIACVAKNKMSNEISYLQS